MRLGGAPTKSPSNWQLFNNEQVLSRRLSPTSASCTKAYSKRRNIYRYRKRSHIRRSHREDGSNHWRAWRDSPRLLWRPRRDGIHTLPWIFFISRRICSLTRGMYSKKLLKPPSTRYDSSLRRRRSYIIGLRWRLTTVQGRSRCVAVGRQDFARSYIPAD